LITAKPCFPRETFASSSCKSRFDPLIVLLISRFLRVDFIKLKFFDLFYPSISDLFVLCLTTARRICKYRTVSSRVVALVPHLSFYHLVILARVDGIPKRRSRGWSRSRCCKGATAAAPPYAPHITKGRKSTARIFILSCSLRSAKARLRLSLFLYSKACRFRILMHYITCRLYHIVTKARWSRDEVVITDRISWLKGWIKMRLIQLHDNKSRYLNRSSLNNQRFKFFCNLFRLFNFFNCLNRLGLNLLMQSRNTLKDCGRTIYPSFAPIEVRWSRSRIRTHGDTPYFRLGRV